MSADRSRTPAPFTHVLCPIDFSAHAAHSLRHAAALVARSGGHLTVLYVNSPLLAQAAAAAGARATDARTIHDEVARFVTATLPARTRAAIRIGYSSAVGDAAAIIARRVRDDGHDAVVLGTRGLRGARRLLFGSTAADVLRRVPVPVLVVPPPRAGDTARLAPRWPARGIVAPVSLGPSADAEVRAATAYARWSGAPLRLVHVVPAPATPPWFAVDLRTHLQEDMQAARLRLTALAATAGGVRTTSVVSTGDAADEVSALALQTKAALVIISRTSARRDQVPGHLSYGVLAEAHIPVLALPPAPRSRRRA